MINLAGREPHVADDTCADELRRAGVKVSFGERQTGEVRTAIKGEFLGFSFHRAWRYWIVEGLMPIEFAVRMYDHPDGRNDVRAGADRDWETQGIHL